MSFVVVFYVTDVWREEVSTTATAILPYLFDFHLFCVDSISYTTRVRIFCRKLLFFELSIVVVVIEAHYITVWCDNVSMLFILPFKVISNWFEDAKYVERALPFRKGSTLVLLTDGVVECKSPTGELFGTERVESVLLQSRGAEDFMAKLKTALSVFSSGKYSDDVTVLAFDL